MGIKGNIRHSEDLNAKDSNVRGADCGRRTHVIDVSNIIVPSDDFLKENLTSVNYILCKPCTTVRSESTTTEHKGKWKWKNSTIYIFFSPYCKLVFTMLWTYTVSLLNVVGTFLGMIWKYYHLQLKVWGLLLTSSLWYIVRWFNTTERSHRAKSTKNYFLGFPAKWLIFSAFMFFATVWNGEYFFINFTNNFILNTWNKRYLSTYTIAHDARCTWNFLFDYNYDQWCKLHWIKQGSVAVTTKMQSKQLKLISNLHTQEEQIEWFNGLDQMVEPSLNYFDAVEEQKPELWFNFLEPTVHVVDMVSNHKQPKSISTNAVPAISVETGLDL